MAQVTINRDTRCYAISKTSHTNVLNQSPTEAQTGPLMKLHDELIFNIYLLIVQAVVEKVKDDFHNLYFSNEKLKRVVAQKV